MSKDKAIVLLSGGMDSATALYWAAKHYEIAAIMNFNYGQHGADFEMAAAVGLLAALEARRFTSEPTIKDASDMIMRQLGIIKCEIRVPSQSSLTHDISLDPKHNDHYGQPMTFVPGRNLIFISYATAVAYNLNAKYIIGGWSSVDVDYPDCSEEFLGAVGIAASHAIGRSKQSPFKQGLFVKSPVNNLTKAETVTLGEELGVPWELTRSCYAGNDKPCLECNSCMLRVKAFITAGVRDPLVSDDDWSILTDNHATTPYRLDSLSGVVKVTNEPTG